jgi:hypothetical protein
MGRLIHPQCVGETPRYDGHACLPICGEYDLHHDDDRHGGHHAEVSDEDDPNPWSVCYLGRP